MLARLPQVVYLPSCVTRMMGPAAGDDQTASVHEKMMSLFSKAGYEVRPPGCGAALSLHASYFGGVA